MKKLLGIVVLGLLVCSNSFAGEGKVGRYLIVMAATDWSLNLF